MDAQNQQTALTQNKLQLRKPSIFQIQMAFAQVVFFYRLLPTFCQLY